MRAAMLTPSPKMSLAVDDDVADVNADPVAQRVSLGRAVAALRHRRLDRDAALDGVYGGAELDQKPVASRFHDAAAVLGDRRIDQASARDRLQTRKRGALALAHEPRVADDVGGHDRR